METCVTSMPDVTYNQLMVEQDDVFVTTVGKATEPCVLVG